MKDFKILVAFFSILAIPLSLWGDEREYKRKINDLSRMVDRMCQDLSSTRGEVRNLSRQTEEMLKIFGWVKDNYKPQKSEAEKAIEDIKKLKEYIKIFEKFHNLFQDFPKRLSDFEKKLERELKEIFQNLEKIRRSLQQDLQKQNLDRTEQDLKKVYYKMAKIGKKVEEFFSRNRDVYEFKRMADKLKNYYGKTKMADKIRDSLQRGVDQRYREAGDKFKNLFSKCREIAKGVKFHKFDRDYTKCRDILELLKKNAKEIKELSRKLIEFKKKTEDKLNSLADKIRSGKIRESMSLDIEIYKELLRFYQDMQRSKVFKALQTNWISQYGKDLKELYPSLQALGKVYKIIREMVDLLNKMPYQAEKDLKEAFARPVSQKDPFGLGKAADEIQKRYVELDRKLRRMAQDALNEGRNIKFRASDRAFSKCQDMLYRNREEVFKEAKRVWRESYSKNYVQWAFQGRKAKNGPFRDGADKIFSEQAREIQKNLDNWSSPFNSGKIPSNSYLVKLHKKLENLKKWCDKNGFPTPRWFSPLQEDVRELLKSLPYLSAYEKENRDLISALEQFKKWCSSQQNRISSGVGSARSLVEFKNIQKEIINSRKEAGKKWTTFKEEVKKNLEVGKKALYDNSSTGLTRETYQNREKWILKVSQNLAEAIKKAARDKEILKLMRGIHK